VAKISIQQKPTFTTDVEIPRIGDKTIKVSFTFGYLDRDQLAELADNEIAHSKGMAELIKKDGVSVREYGAKAEEFEVTQIKLLVKGWGFEDEFNDENILALVRSATAVPDAILKAYKAAYNKAREGN
jgi:hypothetical protein